MEDFSNAGPPEDCHEDNGDGANPESFFIGWLNADPNEKEDAEDGNDG